ncbi:hypothetical protein Lalb_Chr20g0116851 [Lupinus albus]|uniref:Uncharacterized protein n=1 Tax=Lupinus albus TaxID=3870 RepID=A0A6A4NGR6_LUPAL|nr:hypothetical protein Lalb_Chr20g0116851 [Lupinus albus]
MIPFNCLGCGMYLQEIVSRGKWKPMSIPQVVDDIGPNHWPSRSKSILHTSVVL